MIADRREHPVRVLHVSRYCRYLDIYSPQIDIYFNLLSNTVRFFQMTLAGQRGAFLQAILAAHTSSSWVIS